MNEEPQNGQGFFAKRSNKLLVLIIGSFLALAVVTFAAMEYTSTTGFCNQCHIMNPYYNTWATSSHKGVHCYDCHIDEGTFNYLKAKVNGLKELYLVATDSVTTPGKDEKAWDKCQKCHAKLLQPSSQETDSFEHYKHIKSGLNCKQCHGDLIHGQETKDFRQICVDCHKNKVATPASHSAPEFKVTHGQAFLKNNNGCELCHSEGQAQQMCQSCHGVTMPHPANYVDRHVADVKTAAAGDAKSAEAANAKSAEAANAKTTTTANAKTAADTKTAAGTSLCLKCHLEKPDNLPRKAQSCQACHGITMPHPQDFLTGHGKVVQGQGDKACLNCHKEQPAGQNRLAKSCDSCHGIKMPHPQNFQSQHAAAAKAGGSQVCLNCHKDDGKPRKAQTCQQCHGVELPHPSNFLVKHPSTVAAKGTKVCVNCHGDNAGSTVSCQTCHGLPMPHPTGYKIQHTNVVAAQGTKACLNCHKQDNLARKATTCVSCHGLPMPHAQGYITQHTADAKAKGIALCVKCHNGEKGSKAQTCISCHGVQMPHPANWQSTHGESGNIQSCTSCHSPSNPANPKASWASKNFCSNCHSEKPHGDNYLAEHQKDQLDVSSCGKCHDLSNTCAKCHQAFKK